MRLPWRHAPQAALSSVATMLVAAVVGGAVAFVVAMASLHGEAARSAAVQQQVGRPCAGQASVYVNVPEIVATNALDSADTARDVTIRNGGPAAVVGLYGEPVTATVGPIETPIRLSYRDGAYDDLEVIAGGGRDGLWVPSRLAELYGVQVGDQVTVPGIAELPPITAIYRLLELPLDDTWCSEQAYVVQNPLAGESAATLPIFLPDEQTARRTLFRNVGGQRIPDIAGLTLTFPGDTPRTPDEADRYAATMTAIADDLRAELRPTGAGAIPVAAGATGIRDRAVQGGDTVRSALLPLTVVSLLIGLAGMAAVAVQWCARRFAEIRLLWIRGVSPAGLGAKAVAELAAPLTVGTAAGFGIAWSVLPLVSPTTDLNPGSVPTAALLVAATVPVQLLVLAVVSALRVRATLEGSGATSTRRFSVGALPWELALAGVAVWSWLRLRDGALTVVRGEVVPAVDPVALAFPLLVLLTAAAVAARLAVWTLHASHRVRAWKYPAAQLAMRRLAASRRTVAAVLAVAALGIGTIAVGTGVAAAQQEALEAKTDVLVGTRTVVSVDDPTDLSTEGLPPALRGASSTVGTFTTGVGRESYKILFVDPATFADSVTWRDTFDDRPLSEVLAALTTPVDGGAFPAIRVGDAPGGSNIEVSNAGMAVTEVGSIRAFPSLGEGGYVVSSSVLGDDLDLPSWTVWSNLDGAAVITALRDADRTAVALVSRDLALDGLPFLVVIWTFDFFTALGVAMAALAATALLLGAEVRRRQNALAGTLATRMGLRPAALTASHLVELGAIGIGSLVIGVGTGLLATAVAVQGLDPAPRLLGDVLAPDRGPFVVGALLVTALVVAGATTLAVRGVRTAKIRELIRDV